MSKVNIEIPSHRRKLAGFLVELIHQHHGDVSKVLDLGCGVLYSVFKQYWGDKYEGLDVREDIPVDYVGDACDLSRFKTDSRDVVTCYSTIEHVHNPYGLLQEMKRVSSGTCILTTDYTERDKNNDPTHLYCWTPKIFKQLLDSVHKDNKVYEERDILIGVMYRCRTKQI